MAIAQKKHSKDGDKPQNLALYERHRKTVEDSLERYSVTKSDRPWLVRLEGLPAVRDLPEGNGKRRLHEARVRYSKLRRGDYSPSRAFHAVRDELIETPPGKKRLSVEHLDDVKGRFDGMPPKKQAITLVEIASGLDEQTPKEVGGAVLTLLETGLVSGSDEVKAAAASGLSSVAEKGLDIRRFQQDLKSCFQTGDPLLMAPALRALGHTGSRALPTVETGLSSSEPEVLSSALQAVGSLAAAGTDCRHLLPSVIECADNNVGIISSSALSAAGDVFYNIANPSGEDIAKITSNLHLFQENLTHSDAFIRHSAIKGLAKVRSKLTKIGIEEYPTDVIRLGQLLDHKDPSTVAQALDALEFMRENGVDISAAKREYRRAKMWGRSHLKKSA